MNDRKSNDRTREPLIETDRLDLCYPENRADQLALERILTWQQLWRDFGLGPVMAIEKDSSLVVGTDGIFPEARIPWESGMEIGFMMLPDFRKRGFATELGGALTKYIFEEAGAERIVADSHPDNAAPIEYSKSLVTTASVKSELSMKSFRVLTGNCCGR